MRFETKNERDRRAEQEGVWSGLVQGYVATRVCEHNGRITYKDEGRRRVFTCSICGKEVRPV